MKFEGILPALITPLREDETVNTEVLHQLVGDLLTRGVDGFYIGGATGEGLALKTAQRMILAEEAIHAIDGRKPAIVQVAAANFGDAVALAQHAERVGADAISATAPLFFHYDRQDVYNYYKALAESVHIPLMIYYSPAANFPMDAQFAAQMFAVDNITAIKWTSSNYYEMVKLKDMTHGEMNIMNGPDEMLLMGLSAGADGGIGSTYNIMPERIKAIYTAFRSGDMAAAREHQTQADRVIAQILQWKVIPAVKVVLEAMGYNVGNASFPMTRYSDAEQKEIIAAVKNAGLMN